MSKKDLSKLSNLIDEAMAVAVELNETTTIYLLSMASIEVTEKIDAVGGNMSDDD